MQGPGMPDNNMAKPPMGGYQQGPPPPGYGYQGQPGMPPPPGYQQHQPGMPGMQPPNYYNQQPGYPQGNMRPGPMIVVNHYPTEFQAILEMMGGVYVKQKVHWGEVLTGIEEANSYSVFDTSDKRGEPLFKCKEISGFCARQCLSGASRPFEMRVENRVTGQLCMRFSREYTCTCGPCGRPELNVFAHVNGQEQFVGKIVDPYDCCNVTFQLQDAASNHVYTITTACCQCALCCNCPCDDCQLVIFEMKNSSGQVVNKIHKKGKGVLHNMLTDADDFEIRFTSDMDWKVRALLLATIIFIDYRMFEDKDNKRGAHQQTVVSF